MPKNESMNMYISILDEVKKEGSKSHGSSKHNNRQLAIEKVINITGDDTNKEEVKEKHSQPIKDI